jgi:ring-1,2-phenylacetyl-CoA epoxidase subunit PaaD
VNATAPLAHDVHDAHDARIALAWEVLATVLDPEVPALSLCDLGIVRDVLPQGDEAGSALEIVLTPTYSGCPATELIERLVLEAIDAAGLGPARVRLQRAPAWTTDWISAAGRRSRCASSAGARWPARQLPARAAPAPTRRSCRPMARPRARPCTVAWRVWSPSSISSRSDILQFIEIKSSSL